MSHGSSGGYRGLEAREEMAGWGGGVIFSATGERNHKWLDAKSTPPSKLLPCRDKKQPQKKWRKAEKASGKPRLES